MILFLYSVTLHISISNLTSFSFLSISILMPTECLECIFFSLSLQMYVYRTMFLQLFFLSSFKRSFESTEHSFTHYKYVNKYQSKLHLCRSPHNKVTADILFSHTSNVAPEFEDIFSTRLFAKRIKAPPEWFYASPFLKIYLIASPFVSSVGWANSLSMIKFLLLCEHKFSTLQSQTRGKSNATKAISRVPKVPAKRLY